MAAVRTQSNSITEQPEHSSSDDPRRNTLLHVPIAQHVIVEVQSSMIGFRQAVRSFRKAPGLAAIAIVSLAIGIGANVTVFSVVREMILDDMSARNPDRLARVEGIDVSYTLYRQLRTAAAFRRSRLLSQFRRSNLAHR